MKPTRTTSAAICALLMITSCSSDSEKSKTTDATTHATTNATTDGTTDATTVNNATVASTGAGQPTDLGTGIVAGDAFVARGQFVQFEPLSNAWRLHIVDGEHTCDEDLASV